jgi:Fe-S cluster biosynthesis and repair protein YggX
MQTMRLHAYQQPSRVQSLLESLVQARQLLPRLARKIIDRSELPSTLQKLIFQALKSGRVWSAWTDEDHIWLFVAELSLAPSRERGCPALQVSFFREDGKIKEWRQWACLNDGTWQPCAP